MKFEQKQLSVQDLVSRYQCGCLNLAPGFQRDSVWLESDRRKLIQSISQGFPLPAIFLHRRTKEDGNIIFDVIDGKQRIESILMFMGVLRGKFSVNLSLGSSTEDGDSKLYNWTLLKRDQQQSRITGCNLLAIEVDGEPSEVVELFVRINSTGKPLTPAEKRHARFTKHPFLCAAARVANKYEGYFKKSRILSANQIQRMKHIEFLCELMLSIQRKQALNKKATLDHILQAKGALTDLQIKTSAAQAVMSLNRVEKIFPDIASTRFRQLSDFYTLVLLVAKFEREGFILTNGRRNALAQDLLTAFSVEVDRVRDLQKQVKGMTPDQDIYRQYLATVIEGSDEVSKRERREHILYNLLSSLLEKKDSRRSFSAEQRRILWGTTASKRCTECQCDLTWDDFTIDHIKPYSKGGKTNLKNAGLLCRKHNSSKGNRRRKRAKSVAV